MIMGCINATKKSGPHQIIVEGDSNMIVDSFHNPSPNLSWESISCGEMGLEKKNMGINQIIVEGESKMIIDYLHNLSPNLSWESIS